MLTARTTPLKGVISFRSPDTEKLLSWYSAENLPYFQREYTIKEKRCKRTPKIKKFRCMEREGSFHPLRIIRICREGHEIQKSFFASRKNLRGIPPHDISSWNHVAVEALQETEPADPDLFPHHSTSGL